MKTIYSIVVALFALVTLAQAQAPSLPIDFESTSVVYTWTDFNGGVATVIPNPDVSAGNMSATVGSMVKGPGEVFGGSTLALNGPIDFGTNNQFTMNVWANAVGQSVLFKLEGANPVEISAQTTAANQWEEMVFPASGLNGQDFTAITIIYRLGEVGDGSADFTMYFDDIKLSQSALPSPTVPIDFESLALTYRWADFGGGVASVIPNPDASGLNTSARVGSMVKDTGQVFGGSTLALEGPIDFGTNDQFTMKVWSNAPGRNVLFKLEGPTPFEVSAQTTVANQWETLTFPAPGISGNTYTAITFFYRFGEVGDGSADFTLYFDDIELSESGTLAPSLPIDFESTTVAYNWSDFAGGVATVIPNPDASGLNTSATVGSMVKNAGDVFGGSTLALAGPIDFGTNNQFTMKVWSNAPGQSVLFKLEGPTPFEVSAQTTVANQWEELTFPAPGISGNTYTAITLIYRLGENGDGSADFTMYFDDIELSESALPAPSLPIDFESTMVAYNWSDFAGGVATVIPNPDASGLNTSATVGSMVKNAGDVFGGSTLALAAPIDFGTNNQFTMKVWSNAPGQSVLFKLEGPTPFEVSAQTTVANQWEELTFPAPGISGNTYTAITLIYRLGENGDGSADFTMYFDDIELSESALPAPSLPIDFESTMVAYNWSDFAGGVATVIPNPDASGLNTSATVGSMVKNAGDVFGGSTLALAAPIDFGTNNQFTMKVWSNAPGQSVLFKLEGATPYEVSAQTTVANQWEELTFPAPGISGNTYTAITLIYRLGENGDGSADFTMYFDDIELSESALPAPSLPIDFESTMVAYNWSDFAGGVATVIPNPDASGLNTSATVGSMVKNAGDVFGGSTLALAAPIDFGTNNQFTMKVWSNAPGQSVLFKLEGPTPFEVSAQTTVANQWEELTFPAPGISGNTYTAITLIYRLGENGDGSADFTMYFDDIELSESALPAPSLPIDFESTMVAYNWSDFAGGVATVIPNPDASGLNTSATVGSMVKNAGDVFGGSTLALAAPIDFGTNNQFTMKVWSNAPGQSVLFKLEGATPYEVSAQTTVANQWEELTFPAVGISGNTYTAITLIYRLGENGDGSADFTMYFDDIELSESALTAPSLPIDFESSMVAYVWSDFDGGAATVIPNPDASGLNTSATVGSMVKNTGAVFGGSTLALNGPIDFGTNNQFTMKVWSNAPGQSVLLKLEGAAPVEIFDTTTVANQWEELTFPAAGLIGMDFTAITIIYRLGEVGDGSADFTMYFDDIELSEVSKTVDLADLGVSFFPNPVNTALTIQSSGDVQQVEVFNMNGQRVLERAGLNTNTVSTAELTSGTYILRVVTTEGVGTSTFVKR